MARILVVDDDEHICAAFDQFLSDEGHTPLFASNTEDALITVEASHPDLVLMDIRMPGGDGLQALKQIRALEPNAYVVIMTAYGTSQTSIEAMRCGAFDYLTKPLDLDVLKPVVDKALEAQALSHEVEATPSEDWKQYSLVNLVGKSAQMEEAYKLIGLLASNNVPALLIGERGVGKHSVAKTIHFNSDRKEKPFTAIHCEGMSEDFVHTALFGRESGDKAAGSTVITPGKLETANGGTVFLDDIDTLSLPLQAKLLRFLEEKVLDRLGGIGDIEADTRVVAATEIGLGDCVRRGDFNEELFHRLRVLSIHLPPLRERREDIPELVGHFIKRFNADLNRKIKGVDERVLQLMQDYAWPGNAGELENVIQRACVLAPGEVITPEDLGESLQGAHYVGRDEAESRLELAVQQACRQRLLEKKEGIPGSAFHDIVAQVEATLVREVLTATSGNQLKAAERLGLNRTTLRKKMHLYGL